MAGVKGEVYAVDKSKIPIDVVVERNKAFFVIADFHKPRIEGVV